MICVGGTCVYMPLGTMGGMYTGEQVIEFCFVHVHVREMSLPKLLLTYRNITIAHNLLFSEHFGKFPTYGTFDQSFFSAILMHFCSSNVWHSSTELKYHLHVHVTQQMLLQKHILQVLYHSQ